MAAEEILKLFDTYWFEHEVFAASASMRNPFSEIDDEVEVTKRADILPPGTSEKIEKIEKRSACVPSDGPKVPDKTKLSVRSLSSNRIGLSPRSVLNTPFSRNESLEKGHVKRRRKDDRRLSDLEFEELKGFMDLGFVFTEEDKNPSLVSIIPGLERWGQNGGGKEKRDQYSICRPYLSEAWEVLEQQKANRQLMKWKFPDLYNESKMKYHLKVWAHTVATAVRSN